MTETKDLGVKVGSEEEVFWAGVKKKCEDMIKQCKHEIIIQEKILGLAEIKIAEEKEKFK